MGSGQEQRGAEHSWALGDGVRGVGISCGRASMMGEHDVCCHKMRLLEAFCCGRRLLLRRRLLLLRAPPAAAGRGSHLEHLALVKMPDARLGHAGDGDRVEHLLDHPGVGRARDAAVGLDVRRDALQRHHRHRPRRLCDARLFGVHDIHDDSALLEDGKRALDRGAGLGLEGGGVEPRADGRGRRHRRRGCGDRDLGDVGQKVFEPGVVPRDLGMEASDQLVGVARGDDALGDGGEGGDARASLRDQRRTDKVRRRAQRRRRALREGERAELGIDLAAKGIALGGNLEASDEGLGVGAFEVVGEEDQARAHAPNRLGLAERAHRVEEASILEAEADGSRLTARDDERGAVGEVGRKADLLAFGAKARDRGEVLLEGALDGKHSNSRHFSIFFLRRSETRAGSKRRRRMSE